MKKTMTIHFLIVKKDEDSYLGICKEFGFIEEDNSFEVVRNRLIEGSKLLLEAISKNNKLTPALNAKPPLKYLALYYFIPIVASLASLFKLFRGEIHHNSLQLSI